MAIVVDACSLVAMARYYMPLDKEGCVASFLRERFASGELVLLDKNAGGLSVGEWG